MTEKELVTLLETEYLAKILGFCYQKLNDRETAEDLASDITLEVMKVIRSGKVIENFNALVWSISNHTFCKFLRARKSMKEGMDRMREYGEKSFNPEALTVSCQGAPGMDNEPMSFAKRKLSQNILLAAYEEPATIKELCVELGVSAAYVEDEVAALVNNRLMKEVSRGKYQTDFALNGFKREICKIVSWSEIPERPNGGKWIAIGYKNGVFSDVNRKMAERNRQHTIL